MNTYTINFDSITRISDEQFYKLCIQNPELVLEKNINGDLVIMSPTGGETGKKNAELNADFVMWNRQKKLGLIFDSSTCFRLPIGSNRSPDVAYITQERWNKLTEEERIKFPPIAPDFVLELMSNTDFDSSTCFRLPIGSNRSPDVAYITQERWNKLMEEERIKFPPIAPDFVLELMSNTDSLKTLQEKMEEYKSSGVKLAWLLNPEKKEVEIYRQGQEKEVLSNPKILSGEEVLPDFILDLSLIW